MIYLLFYTLLLLPTCMGWGKMAMEIFSIKDKSNSLVLLIGMLVISLFYTLFAFIIPLNFWVEVTAITIGIGSFFKLKIHKSLIEFLQIQTFFFYLTIIISLFFASFYPFILDHFGYYIPSILWLQQFGLVKGIANLDILLGQMSFWHLLQAGFSNVVDGYYKINILVLICYLLYIFEKKSWTHLLFIPFLYLFVQSPSPDLPAIVFSLMILNEIVLGNKNISLLLGISIWVFALKPTVIWLPLFCFLYGFLILKSNWKTVFFALCIFTLFVVKNLYCFGFPIFPVTTLNFGIPWQPNAKILQLSSQTAIEKTFDMQYTYQEISKFTRVDFIKNWLFIGGIKSIIHLLFIVILIVFGILSWQKKNLTFWLLYVSIVIKSVLVLLFSAQYRFFLEVFIVFGFVCLHPIQINRKIKSMYLVSSIALGISLSFPKLLQEQIPSFNLGYFMTGFHSKQLLIPENYEYKKYKKYTLGNLTFNLTQDYPFNFDTPIPAISPSLLKEDYEAGIVPQLKNKELKQGFIWRKLTQSEREKLKTILKENPSP